MRCSRTPESRCSSICICSDHLVGLRSQPIRFQVIKNESQTRFSWYIISCGLQWSVRKFCREVILQRSTYWRRRRGGQNGDYNESRRAEHIMTAVECTDGRRVSIKSVATFVRRDAACDSRHVPAWRLIHSVLCTWRTQQLYLSIWMSTYLRTFIYCDPIMLCIYCSSFDLLLRTQSLCVCSLE